MTNALAKLQELQGGVDIPGLQFDAVVSNLVDTKYKGMIDAGAEGGDELRKSLIKYYTETARMEIQSKIDTIKSCFSTAKSQIESLQQSIVNVAASNAIPSVITAGAATSVPNPAHFIIENRQKKQALMSAAKGVIGTLSTMLIAAISIYFELPPSVSAVIDIATKVISIITSIPS